MRGSRSVLRRLNYYENHSSRFLVKACRPTMCPPLYHATDCFPKIPKSREGSTVKKQINPSIKAHLLWSTLAFGYEIMQRPGSSLISLIVFGAVALGLPALAAAPEQNIVSPASLRPSVATHESRVRLQAGLQKLIEF